MNTDSTSVGLPPQQAFRVLVVDDCADIAASWQMILEMAGYEVAAAHDGLEALVLIDRHDPHIILCDLMMPRLDGYGVAKKLQERSKPKPFLVAITAHGSDEDRRRCFRAGFDRHFTKPVDAATILELLGDVLALLADVPNCQFDCKAGPEE
jgi:CheY-like chemotaxis protein